MRRTVRWAAVVALMALNVGVGAAEESRPMTSGRSNLTYDGIIISNPGASARGEDVPVARRATRKGARGPVRDHAIRETRFLEVAEEDYCLETSFSRRKTPMEGTEDVVNMINDNFARDGSVPACSSPAQGEVTPAQMAEAFLRTVPLPPPAPEIAPDGQAITGLAAFLETNGALTHAIGPEPTALGPISVEATGAYWVDWGDGSPEAGPFAFEGEAYPTGRIWHHYRWTGDYTVTLRQRWSATWRLGGDSGTVEGLLTETTVPVEVFEVQAVIRR